MKVLKLIGNVFNELLRCQLCWRVTLLVFAGIVVIETLYCLFVLRTGWGELIKYGLMTALPATVLIMVLVRFYLLAPLLRFYELIEKVSNGKIKLSKAVFNHHRHDELGKIFDNFNQMVSVIDEAHRHEFQLSEEKIRAIARFPEENMQPVMRVDSNGKLLYANRASNPLLSSWGVSINEKIPHHFKKFASQALAANENRTEEVSVSEIEYLLHYTPIADQNYVNIYGLDITERKYYEREAQHLRSHDVLTDLPGFALFQEYVQYLFKLSEGNREKVAIMTFGINDLHDISSAYGILIADRLLVEVVERIKNQIGDDVRLARIGSNRFVMAQGGLKNSIDAESLAQVVISSAEEDFNIENNKIHISFSVGIAIFPDDCVELGELLEDAEIAMHRSRKSGQNQVQYYIQGMNKRVKKRRALLSELRNAYKNKDFYLVYQPQYNIADRSIVGVEALLRWNHPQFGQVSPVEFIPLLEESDLIIDVGDWVIETGITQVEHWQRQGLKSCRLAVNLSIKQFNHPELAEKIKHYLSSMHFPPHKLKLEVTESIMLQNPEHVLEIMRHLHDNLGAELSIDDFGTGYSSLNYLRRLPLDQLKIDRSFVNDIDKNKESEIITQSIINLGHSLGMKVIAEGVETEAQLECLKRQGCDEVQGFFLSRPLTVQQFEQRFEI